MQILSVVGSLRAGKSSLVENTILQGVQTGMIRPNRVAYLLNDRPSDDGRMVDGDRIRNVAQVIPFPNRCFTCEDSDNLVRKLRELSKSGSVDVVVIEGYGFVAGAETRHVLETTGYKFGVFCLVDAEHLAQNRAAYGQVIESQIAAADMGVGITHIEVGDPDSAFNMVNENVRSGVAVMPIPKGYGIPPRLLASFFASQAPDTRCRCSHCSGLNYGSTRHEHHGHGHHGHGHHHDHAHHDFFSVTYPLRADVTVEGLRGALHGLPIFRAKGIASGVRFDLLHDTWSESGRTERPGIITLYSRAEEIRIPESLIDRDRPVHPQGSTKSLLREDIDPEAARAALERLASAIPAEPVVLPGHNGQRVAVQLEEIQLIKQIAQRPSVKAEWLPKALIAVTRYKLACADFIAVHENEMDETELSITQLELALSLGWWAAKHPELIGQNMLAEVARCCVGELLVRGVTSSHSPWTPHSNDDLAIMQAEEFADITRFAIENGEEPSHVLRALEVGVDRISARSPEVRRAWQTAMASV